MPDPSTPTSSHLLSPTTKLDPRASTSTSSARARASSIHDAPHVDAAASSALRPPTNRMRSRGRSITGADTLAQAPASSPYIYPASSSSSSSSNLLLSTSPSAPSSVASSVNPFRIRPQTLHRVPSLVFSSSTTPSLPPLVEPDTPDKPFGDLPPALRPPSLGLRSRSFSLGERKSAASAGAAGDSALTMHAEEGAVGLEGDVEEEEEEAEGKGRRPSTDDRSAWNATDGLAAATQGGKRALTRVGDFIRRTASPSSSPVRLPPLPASQPIHDSPSSIDQREHRSRWQGGEDDQGREGRTSEDSESSLNAKMTATHKYPLVRHPTLTLGPPTPPPEEDEGHSSFASPSRSAWTSLQYFPREGESFLPSSSASLPTPALSTASLSGGFFASSAESGGDPSTTTVSTPNKAVSFAEVRELARGMVPQLLGIAVAFAVSLGVVMGLMTSLPLPAELRSTMPKSASDIRSLAACITDYMAASSRGWCHTMVALGVTAVWTHAWSVPGSVVLNILVGALLPSVPAVLFLTLATTVGGFMSYLLAAPLAPLISLLLPTQLAVVRASIGIAPSSSSSSGGGGKKAGAGLWRKLLVMRATGLVPWSGMNVACGVLGVRWQVFCGTFAAGSLSWNYVTSQIGAILMRLSSTSSGSSATSSESESLTSLVRDPTLILKLLALSLLTLLPVLLKPRTVIVSPSPLSTSTSQSAAPVERHPYWTWVDGVFGSGSWRGRALFPGLGLGKRVVGRAAMWAREVLEGSLGTGRKEGEAVGVALLGRRASLEDGDVIEMR